MAKGQGATMAEHLLLAWKDAMSFSGPLIMQSEVDVVAQEEWVCGSIFSRLELAAVCGAAAESCHANSLLTAVDATVPVPAVLSVSFFARPRSTPPLGSTFLDRCLRPKSQRPRVTADHNVEIDLLSLAVKSLLKFVSSPLWGVCWIVGTTFYHQTLYGCALQASAVDIASQLYWVSLILEAWLQCQKAAFKGVRGFMTR